jgi:hypothetical protein
MYENGCNIGNVPDCPDCEDNDRRVERLERRMVAVVKWLEENQPDVFQRGLWDAINTANAKHEDQA